MKKLTLFFALCAALGANADDYYNPIIAPYFSSTSADLRYVDFNTSEIVYNSTMSPYYNGVLYKDLDLRYARFMNSNLTGASFQNKNLDGVLFSNCTMTDVDLSGASINKARISSCITADQLKSTSSYQSKNLDNVSISSGHFLFLKISDFSGESFSGFTLNFTYFYDVNLIEADFTNTTFNSFGVSGSDLRGAKGLTDEILQNMTSAPCSYISPDGSVYAEDEMTIVVCKNTLNSIVAHVNTDTIFRNFAMESGAFLRIDEGASLTAGGEVVQNELSFYPFIALGLNNNEGALIQVEGTFNIGESNMRVYLSLDDTFNMGEYYEFTLIETVGDGVINGEYIKKSNFALDSLYKGEWDVISTANKVMLVLIPEPAEYAAIFALLALGFAVYFKRKK